MQTESQCNIISPAAGPHKLPPPPARISQQPTRARAAALQYPYTRLQVVLVQEVLVLAPAAKEQPGRALAVGRSALAAGALRRGLCAAVLQEAPERGHPCAGSNHHQGSGQGVWRAKGAASAQEDGQADGRSRGRGIAVGRRAIHSPAVRRAATCAAAAGGQRGTQGIQPGGGHALPLAKALGGVADDGEGHLHLKGSNGMGAANRESNARVSRAQQNGQDAAEVFCFFCFLLKGDKGGRGTAHCCPLQACFAHSKPSPPHAHSPAQEWPEGSW